MSGGSVSSWLLRGLAVELYENTERKKTEVHFDERSEAHRDVVRWAEQQVLDDFPLAPVGKNTIPRRQLRSPGLTVDFVR